MNLDRSSVSGRQAVSPINPLVNREIVNPLFTDQIAILAASPRGDDRAIAAILTITIENAACPRLGEPVQ